MFKDIPDNLGNTLRGSHSLLPVDIIYILVADTFLLSHRVDVVNPERKDIAIIDCIDNRIGMELVSKGLRCCQHLQIAAMTSIGCKDRSSRKTKQMVVPECLHDSLMHVTELASVALIKDYDTVSVIDRMGLVCTDEIV